MPKGFRNRNQMQRQPWRRVQSGPLPPPPIQGTAGFRPGKEKNRPPGWWTVPKPAEPPPPPEAGEKKEEPKEKPAEPEKKP